MVDKTILYYTSNREDPKFEAKIRANIDRQKGKLPIVSVSQKPIDFGQNICVGNVGLSYLNEWRQMLMGAKIAKTPYLILAESDYLYPKEYFRFKPDGENVYRYEFIWIVFAREQQYFLRKEYSEGAQICKREYLIKTLSEHLEGQPEWFDGRFIVKRGGRLIKSPFVRPSKFFGKKIACISFKTGRGVRWMTDTMQGSKNRRRRLAYWGRFEDLKKEYLS